MRPGKVKKETQEGFGLLYINTHALVFSGLILIYTYSPWISIHNSSWKMFAMFNTIFIFMIF